MLCVWLVQRRQARVCVKVVEGRRRETRPVAWISVRNTFRIPSRVYRVVEYGRCKGLRSDDRHDGTHEQHGYTLFRLSSLSYHVSYT